MQLSRAEAVVDDAKQRARIAKRRRKEAKEAARLAKKEVKVAKEQLDAARKAMARAEVNLARASTPQTWKQIPLAGSLIPSDIKLPNAKPAKKRVRPVRRETAKSGKPAASRDVAAVIQPSAIEPQSSDTVSEDRAGK